MLHTGHKLVQLANGQWSLHCTEVSETYHPVIGPTSEADILYAGQIHLERIATSESKQPFVVWDVGLGGAANALAVIQRASQYEGTLDLYSFEHNLDILVFALENADRLPYLQPFVPRVRELLEKRKITFQHGSVSVNWQIIYGDFPTWLGTPLTIPSPAAILYDAFSPKKNPDMYTLSLFTQLRSKLSDATPCLLTSYSRATLLRVTLLLAGFYVGKGAATGEKEETTVASNTLSLIEAPLDATWLGRVQRSTSAEPLHTADYLQHPLASTSWDQLRAHPQFACLPQK